LKKVTYFFLTIIFSVYVDAYSQHDSYFSSGGEWIFSSASIVNNGKELSNGTLRFSPWYNIQAIQNEDYNNKIGLFCGGSMRNIGFIYQYTNADNQNVMEKLRNYTLGIPVGFKIGTLNKNFLFFGYEPELPFHFKSKTFINERKTDKYSVFFSKRTALIYHTAFLGYQFKSASIKFKYYFSNFFNTSYSEDNTLIYKDIRVNIFYFSIQWDLFNNSKEKIKEDKKIFDL